MKNCIFSGHCFERSQCDGSCPALAQSTYLMERNGLTTKNYCFHMKPEDLKKYSKFLEDAKGTVSTYVDNNSTTTAADCLTYCGIAETWKGSQLHCTTYNLKFAQYIDLIYKSWSPNSESNSVDYMTIWATSAKILIISNLDFVNFNDTRCTKLLSILQSRTDPDMTTILVSPSPSNLVGEGQFFAKLTDILNKGRVVM